MFTHLKYLPGRLIGIAGLLAGLFIAGPAAAEAPGRGLTAAFEIDYLKSIINHHYSALRITELAAGTDPTRNAPIMHGEGTSPTPGTSATSAKATMDDIKSMARKNNRMQREEIMMAQGFLKDWYGITYAPQLSRTGNSMIQLLERTPAGPLFDHYYLEVLSRHHYEALGPSLTCVVASDVLHHQLQPYCNGIVQMQLSDINDMREKLAKQFNIVDYQPISGIKGVHTGDEGEAP